MSPQLSASSLCQKQFGGAAKYARCEVETSMRFNCRHTKMNFCMDERRVLSSASSVTRLRVENIAVGPSGYYKDVSYQRGWDQWSADNRPFIGHSQMIFSVQHSHGVTSLLAKCYPDGSGPYTRVYCGALQSIGGVVHGSFVPDLRTQNRILSIHRLCDGKSWIITYYCPMQVSEHWPWNKVTT